MFGLLILYKTGISTITQEAFSTCLDHCLCVYKLLLFYKTGTNTTTQEVLSIALGAK